MSNLPPSARDAVPDERRTRERAARRDELMRGFASFAYDAENYQSLPSESQGICRDAADFALRFLDASDEALASARRDTERLDAVLAKGYLPFFTPELRQTHFLPATYSREHIDLMMERDSASEGPT